MTDTSSVDQGDAPPPPQTWTPPPGAPSPLRQLAGVWQRGIPKTPDQPTTVASLGPQPPVQQIKPRPQPWSRPEQPPRPSPPDTPALSPTGVPPPIRRFSPYYPARPDRPPEQWGQPPMFPRLPMAFEVPGVYRGAGNWFAQNGSGITALLGLGLGRYAGDFMASYNKGMEYLSKQQAEQMKNHAIELEIRQKEESDEYADVINAYGAVNYQPLNGVRVEDAIAQIAMQYNDDKMLAVLGAGGVKAAYSLIQSRDSKWQDIHSSNKTADKEAEDAKDLAEAGVPGFTAEAASPGATTLPGPGQTPQLPRGAPPPPGAPAAPQAPPAPTQPETQEDRIDLLKPYQRDGLDLLRGGNMQGVAKAVQPYAKAYAEDILGQMDNLVGKAREGKMSPDEIEQALRKINPAIAGEFADIRDLNTPLPGGLGAINAHPFWRDIQALAVASVPGWQVSDYVQIGDMKRDYTTGTSSKRMIAANSMGETAVPVLEALRNIPEGAIPPANWISQIAANRFTGDPRWVTLYNTLNQYIQHSQGLASPTGRPYEADISRLMGELNVAQGTRAIRSIIASDARAASLNLDDLIDQYKDGTHKEAPPPHYSPRATAILHALATLDPDKGFADRTDIPPELRGLGMGQQDKPNPAAAPPPPAAPTPGWGTLQ